MKKLNTKKSVINNSTKPHRVEVAKFSTEGVQLLSKSIFSLSLSLSLCLLTLSKKARKKKKLRGMVDVTSQNFVICRCLTMFQCIVL